MRLSSIPQVYRNANRWREVLAVLSKHGLADWLGRIGVPLGRRLRKPPDGETTGKIGRD